MPEPKRMVALAIGIADAEPLPYLAGAINGARAFHDWAKASGYEAHLLLDEDDPVTIDLLKTKIYDIIGFKPKARSITKPPIHRFVLYFAGHGLIAEIEQGLWLLSDWRDEGRAVAVEALKRQLAKFGIKQVSIFADACRKLPPTMDTADLGRDKVLGEGPHEPIPFPDIDKFIATHDGTATIMIPGASSREDRCLFSGVLMEGLWGTKPNAFSDQRKGHVTSTSLGTYLKEQVPEVAKRYGRIVHPEWTSNFPDRDNSYYGEPPAPKAPALPDWPRPDSIKSIAGRGANSKLRSLDLAKKKSGRLLVDRMRKQKRPESFETRSGFAVDDATIAAVWVGTANFTAPGKKSNWWHVGQKSGYTLARPVPALIEFTNGNFAAVTSLPGFVASLTYRDDGVSALVYRLVHSGLNFATRTEEALGEIESGQLMIGAKADLAVELRKKKHTDPVLGIISGYLYDSIGDIESIRRLAYYYATFSYKGQPIPYDIAMLGQLKGKWRKDGQLSARVPPVKESKPRTRVEQPLKWTYEKTKAATGVVGGVWPWLRQGWAYLDEPSDTEQGSPIVREGLARLKRHLTKGRFTTMDKKGGRKLAELFDLHRTKL